MINKEYNSSSELFDDLVDGKVNHGEEEESLKINDFSGISLSNFARRSEDIWEKLLNYMNEKHLSDTEENDKQFFIREKFFNKDSVVEYINDNADLSDNLLKNYIKEAVQQEGDTHWNESIAKLIDYFYNQFQNNNTEIDSTNITIGDIKKADAGNSFKGIKWVIPWENIDKENYEEVRDKDKILRVLNSKKHLQFTRLGEEEYNIELPGTKKGSYTIGYPDMNNDGEIDAIDASYILSLTRNDAITTQEDLDKLNFYGTGPVDYVIAAEIILKYYAYKSTGQNVNWFDYIKSEYCSQYKDMMSIQNVAKYLRLIMPKYQRIVEIEDLNRNFWVIGQVLTGLCSFLFDEDSPLKHMFDELLDEISQLWENIFYLWLANIVENSKNYKETQTIFLPLTPYLTCPYLKYDNFMKDSGYADKNYVQFYNDKVSQQAYLDSIKQELKRLSNTYYGYLKDKYQGTALTIIPEIRQKNYAENYYARAVYIGIIIYDESIEDVEKEFSAYLFNAPIVVDLSTLKYTTASGENSFSVYNIYETNTNYYITNTNPITGQNGLYHQLLRCKFSGTFSKNDDTWSLHGASYLSFEDIGKELKNAVSTAIQYNLVQNQDVINITANFVPAPVISSDWIDKTKGYYRGELLSWYKIVS